MNKSFRIWKERGEEKRFPSCQDYVRSSKKKRKKKNEGRGSRKRGGRGSGREMKEQQQIAERTDSMKGKEKETKTSISSGTDSLIRSFCSDTLFSDDDDEEEEEDDDDDDASCVHSPPSQRSVRPTLLRKRVSPEHNRERAGK